jgi:hypothetical protein
MQHQPSLRHMQCRVRPAAASHENAHLLQLAQPVADLRRLFEVEVLRRFLTGEEVELILETGYAVAAPIF